uniref:Methyltransferase FkbM domain-containing protein n=1 Tax=Alexandrium catenella TaxID=2925 RepID=A0A7S1QZ55_ALECA
MLMHLFEPSPTFFNSLSEAVGGMPGLRLHNFGLGARTRRAHLRLSGTASRTVDPADGHPDETERVLIRAVAEAVPEVLAGQGSVELLHVNCEGCEYDVVDGLRSAGLLPGVAQVQLATHLLDYPEPTASFREAVELSLQASVVRYCEMHRALSETHTRVWGLPWV